MKVEIWSDVVCPWCYIGKRRFERALEGFAHRGEVEVVWRSFELDPTAPAVRDGDPAERLAAKYGMSVAEARAAQLRITDAAAGEGLAYRLAAARSGNTFDAHRLLHLAAERGSQDRLKERLLSAYLCEEQAIGHPDVLTAAAAAAGIDAGEARAALESGAYADAVRSDEAEAAALGISAVPFFVIDRRYGVSGAQDPAVIRAALERAWGERQPLVVVRPDAAGPGCEGDSCPV